MTDTMMERVAAAIDAKLVAEHVVEHWPFEMLPKTSLQWKLARAALQALREPTPQMLADVAVKTQPASEADYALASRAVELLPPSDHPDAGDVLAELARDWRNFIDAALRGYTMSEAE